jgi:cell division transport system permease protein
VHYISKASALSTYRQENVNNKQLLQAISETDNPLPASLEVNAKNPKDLGSIVAIISQPANSALQSDPPSYSGTNKTTIDRIVHFADFFKKGGTYASILFIIISVLIIFNTIRMAIFTRRDEIEIMKLVGATKWFIRGPFLIEAAMYGVIAAVIALVLSYSLLLGAGPKLASYIDVNSTIHVFRSYPVLVVGGELLIGIAIGGLSSLLAMSRYLKL